MLLPLVLLGSFASRTEGGDPAPPPQVEITTDTTWSGEVKVEGQVRVVETATLRIAPGTRVVVIGAARRRAGAPPRRLPGIEVAGSLIAEGTSTQPITFLGVPVDARGHAEWNGIQLGPGPASRRHELRACTFRRLDVCVQDVAENTLVEQCTFCNCGTAVRTGTWIQDDGVRLSGERTAPRIRSCRFGWCSSALELGYHSRSETIRCWFLECDVGVNSSASQGLQQIVERCDFEGCVTCVDGSCCVANCIFEQNDVVFAPFGADVSLRANNLCVRNKVLVQGDGLPGDLRRADDVGRLGPRPRTDPDALAQIRVDRAPWAALKPTSPGRGYATDGGDVGIEGDMGTGPPSPPEPDLGARPTHLLLLGPLHAIDATTANGLAAPSAAVPPQPGDLAGALQWVLLTPSELADVQRRLGGTPPRSRVVCAVLEAGAAVQGELALGWDGVARAWWNGAPLTLPTSSRRRLPGDVRAAVAAKAGANVLLVEQRPREHASALEVAFAIAPGAGTWIGWRGTPGPLEPPAPAPQQPVLVRLGKEKPGPVSLQLEIPLPPGARWIELLDPTAYLLRDAAGARTSLQGAQVTLDPRNAKILLRLAERPRAGTYELVLPSLRSAAGHDLGTPPPHTIRVPK
jgi:hypothetical protein